jgi:hypothetical protein
LNFLLEDSEIGAIILKIDNEPTSMYADSRLAILKLKIPFHGK